MGLLASFPLTPQLPNAAPPAGFAGRPPANFVQSPTDAGGTSGGPVTISCTSGAGASVTLAIWLGFGTHAGVEVGEFVGPVLLSVPGGGSAPFSIPSGAASSVAAPAQSPNLQLMDPSSPVTRQLQAAWPQINFAIARPPPLAAGIVVAGILVTVVSGSGPYSITVSQ